MNDRKITELLRKRDKMLTRRDGLYDHAVIDAIDAQLAAVEPGKRNDVDLALGRTCATLPDRPVYDADFYRRILSDRAADAASPEPQYASLPKLTKTATVYNDCATFTAAVDAIDGYGMMGDRD